jgi:hypothetical protein
MNPKLTRDPRFLKLNGLLGDLQVEYGLSAKQVLEECQNVLLPISVFQANLSAFELIVKFLREDRAMSPSQIVQLTGRTKQGVYQTYKNACKRHPGRLMASSVGYVFPIRQISQGRYTILETIVVYLKEQYHLSFSSIAKLLHRDPRTIWTVFNRARLK